MSRCNRTFLWKEFKGRRLLVVGALPDPALRSNLAETGSGPKFELATSTRSREVRVFPASLLGKCFPQATILVQALFLTLEKGWTFFQPTWK